MRIIKKVIIIQLVFILIFTFNSLEPVAASNTDQAKLMLVPLDDRPANIYFPEQVAKSAGIELVMPPKDVIGYYTVPGHGNKIAEWILNNGDNVDGFVISVSMLAYGGLIASRTGEQTKEIAFENIDVINGIKERYPDKPVYVYDTIQRLAVTSSNEDYAEYYDLIREWAILYDKVNNFSEFESERDRLEELEEKIPDDVMDDYINARERNHEVNKELIELTASGGIDYLILAQDDADPYGLHRLESEILVDKIKEYNLSDKVSVFPGADEVDVVFVGRFASYIYNEMPTFYIEYGGQHGSEWIAPFEDQSFDKNVYEHIISAGGKITENEENADIHILFNTPSATEEEHEQDLNNLVDRINFLLENDKQVTIGDVLIVNKADEDFVTKLATQTNVHELLSYSGWNTAGNALGIAVGHSVSRESFMKQNSHSVENLEEAAKSHYEFLLHRFAKDQGYKNVVKDMADKLIRDINANAWDLGNDYDQINQFIDEKLSEETMKWYEYFDNQKIYIGSIDNKRYYSIIDELVDTHVKLPWPRTFEAELEPRLTLYLQTNELSDYLEELYLKNLNEEDFTPISWELFAETLIDAEKLIIDGTSTEEMQKNVLEKLQVAYQSLAKRAKNKDKLSNEIKLVESMNLIENDYTPKSWQAFQDTLLNAQKLLNDENVTDEMIIDAIENLENALEKLEKVPIIDQDNIDTTQLEKLINKIVKENLSEHLYTNSTWEAFILALDNANAIVNKNDVSEKEIKNAIDELKLAYEGLIEVSEEEGKANPDDSSQETEGSKLPQTSTPYFNMILIGLSIVTFGIIVLLYTAKRRTKKTNN